MDKAYLSSINKPLTGQMIQDMKDQAFKHHIPIITDDGIRFIIQILKIKQAKKVLEIGTAIGYSSILMALFAHVKVTTIERDHQSYLMALDNVKKALMNDQIDIIFGDAHDVEVTDDDFDVIFIDAAKASYIRFFEKFKDHLKTGGIIITDNLLFRGMVSDSEQVIDKNKRQLVKKIRDYNEYIINHKMFDTCIYDIGDGISVSIKK